MRRRVPLLLLLASCSNPALPVADATPDTARPDVAPAADAGPLPLAVDFTVANCPQLDPTVPSCTGTVPFTVQFVAVATAGISKYLWNFGDGTNDTSATPSHTFTTAKSFDVTLSGIGPTGGPTPPRTHPGFIVALLADETGDPCQTDQQCAAPRACLCSTTNPCTTGPVNGMCTSLCQKGECPVGSLCANLASAATMTNANRADPWQTQVCLPACRSDTDCNSGLRCRTLPGWPNGAVSVRGCFTDVPADLGGPCLSATGVLRSDLCVTGLCADLGAFGQCSRDCTNTVCPVGSDCAVFGDGRALCLIPCSTTFECDQDPLLTCAGAGDSLLGYQLKAQPISGGGEAYCAPRPCANNIVCEPAGLCRQDSGVGHCVARPK